MSQQKEIQALYQISDVLIKAFQQIHQITGNLLNRTNPKKNDKSEESSKPTQNEEKKASEKKKEKTEQAKPESQKPKEAEGEGKSKKQQLNEKKQKKKAAHPDRPKYPLSAYFRFNSANLDKIKGLYPDLAQKELVSISSMLWNKLSTEEKKPYEIEAEKDKKAYNIALEKFFDKHPEERPKKGPHHKEQ